jgi:hypothetical protein
MAIDTIDAVLVQLEPAFKLTEQLHETEAALFLLDLRREALAIAYSVESSRRLETSRIVQRCAELPILRGLVFMQPVLRLRMDHTNRAIHRVAQTQRSTVASLTVARQLYGRPEIDRGH